MFLKKFNIVEDSGNVVGYGLVNKDNGYFSLLEKKKALELAAKNKLRPYVNKAGVLYAGITSTGLWSKITGAAKVEQLALERCAQFCGEISQKYMLGTSCIISGVYIYMESVHNRLYMLGHIYVPSGAANKYSHLMKQLMRNDCLVSGTGSYNCMLDDGKYKGIVSLDNVFDLTNLMTYFLNSESLLLDLGAVSHYDYTVAGEQDMFEAICKNYKEGKYFAELDANHHFMGLVSYTRGISKIRHAEKY